MDTVRRHAVLTAVGLVLGSATVYWLEPETLGGTTFVMVTWMALVNAVGAIPLPSVGRSTGGESAGEGASGEETAREESAPESGEETERS